MITTRLNPEFFIRSVTDSHGNETGMKRYKKISVDPVGTEEDRGRGRGNARNQQEWQCNADTGSPTCVHLSLGKVLFRHCFDRKAPNEICQVRDSAIGERGACKIALVDVARDYFILLSFLTDIYLFLG
jgi:hypothetical protein